MKRKPKKSYFTGPARATRKKLRKPSLKARAKPARKVSRNGRLPSKGKPKPAKAKQRKKNMPDDEAQKKLEEAASRLSGKIRNLENEVNSRSSAPPDPGIAAQFDAIQAELEQLKTGGKGQSGKGAEDKDEEEDDNGNGHHSSSSTGSAAKKKK